VITVFKGEEGLPADDEAADIWRKVTGFGDDRILRLGMADNFWSMGDTGPCGPCSEIHFFHGSGEADVGSFGEEPRIDGLGLDRDLEPGLHAVRPPQRRRRARPLPAPSIDTGMGLERISAAVQGVTSNYDTELLRVAGRASRRDQRQAVRRHDRRRRRVDAGDRRSRSHDRVPHGRGGDAREAAARVRPTPRHAPRHPPRSPPRHRAPFLHEVALRVVERMGETYPELVERKELISRVTLDEEVRFRATLKRGIKILEERFGDMRASGHKELPSTVAADLFTTYGFPLDLTEVICKEAGFDVDVKEADKVVHGASEADGPIDPNAALDPIYHAIKTETGAVSFSGYEHESGESEVIALVRVTREGEGDRAVVRRELAASIEAPAEIELVVRVTPFYAESGGQVGDHGVVTTASGAKVVVRDTQRPVTGLVVHQGTLDSGTLARGDTARLEVDHDQRAATRRNHSATHLLHWALKRVLGEHAMQKGSRVGPDVLRFDFAHNKSLSREEVEQIEDLVNAKVLTNEPVLTEVIPIDEAKKRGAVAIFEEKYGTSCACSR
jgi:alanyl-tRNA synthetase